MFESTENQFRKSFSVKSMRLAAMEIRFFGKSFPFDQNFTLLTRKSFYIVVLPLNDFRKKRKREKEPQKEKTHANKTQTAQERENDRRLSRSWSPELRRSELIAIVIDALCDRDLAIDASRDLADLVQSIDRDLAIDRNLADRDRDHDLTEKMWSFLSFICVFRNEWYYVFVW